MKSNYTCVTKQQLANSPSVVGPTVAAITSLAPQVIWPEAPRAVVPREAATFDEWMRG
jgi:hypothetical protein